jgi:hypothetical protein
VLSDPSHGSLADVVLFAVHNLREASMIAPALDDYAGNLNLYPEFLAAIADP